MMNFQFSIIRYDFEVLNNFETPYFLGSTFRGIMGKKLKRMVCIKPREDCKNCEFKMTCPYTVIFDTEVILNQPSKYIMRPPFENTELKEGDTLSLEITLLGETANYWEFITQTYTGVLNLGRERYIKLKDVYFYHPFRQKFYPVKSFIPKFEAIHFFDLVTGKDEINLRLYPTSLKSGGKIVKASDFNKDIFIKAVVSRISNVVLNYGLKEGKIFIDKDRFKITEKKLRPSPMKRWSNRKKTHMTIPAFEGNITIKGDLQGIYPYLNILEIINMGKSVSFGLGKVKIY